MVENKETRSHNPRQPLRHCYTLADGQRIPVLFRMKNIQSAAVASARTGAPKAGSQNASTRVDVKATQAPLTKAAANAPEPTLAGPSWLRRNAYRFTVAVLLVVTFLVLSNNQKQAASTLAKDDVKLEAPVVELATARPVPSMDAIATTSLQPSLVVETPKAEVSKTEVVKEETPVIAPPALAEKIPAKADPRTIVETTESETSTSYLISKPAADPANDSSVSALANESGFNTSTPLASTMLLAPQTLAKPVTGEPSFSQPLTNEQPGLAAEVPATAVSTSIRKNPELHSSNPQNNRYATAPGGSAWQGQQNGPQSTNDPNLDPSVLFKIKQNYQVNSLEQTVRDMRQQAQAQTQTPSASPSANQWQAIPAASALPPSAFAPRNNMGLQPQVQPPASAPNALPANTSNVLQPNSPQNVPRRSTYEPVGPSLGLPTDSSLYSEATTPDGSPTNTPTKREPYKPLYGQPQTQPTATYGSPTTSNELYETADQSFMGN